MALAVEQKLIEQEMKESYIVYAMSVIVGRALPDVRDGLKPVHRRVLFTMHELGNQHSKPYKKSARIVGDCFVKDTLVSTPKGLIPIQDLNLGDMVYTQGGKQKITKLYIMPAQELTEVIFENGLRNLSTKGQMYKVLNKDTEFKWKKASELKTGDYIVSRSMYPENSKYQKKAGFTINENLAYLLGLFLSDGWVDKNRQYCRLAVQNNSKEAVFKIKQIFKKEFNAEENVGKRNNSYLIRLNSTEKTKKFLSVFNIENKKAENIFIPELILCSPKSVIFAFLSGIIDGDGSVHKNRNTINITSISEKFIDNLQVLLLSLGAYSQKYKNAPRPHFCKGRLINSSKAVYALEVQGSNILILKDNLNLFNKEKRERLAKIITNTPPQSDFLPYFGAKVFREFSQKHLGGGWYLGKDGRKFRLGIKYKNGTKIRYCKNLKKSVRAYKGTIESLNILDKLRKMGSPLAEKFERILESNLSFIRIKAIRKAAPEITYDIQVAVDHEFLANNIIAHNCLGKYHPHGDVAVYDTMVRMAQSFSLRYPLVEGQGNWGSIDGDSAASMRYTEARMAKIADEMLTDIEKETVDFTPNFDGTMKEPVVMPAKLPNLLINGSTGIAVGMATNIPPHNLKEICNAVLLLADKPDALDIELMDIVKGPDFPTGAQICGTAGIRSAYKTGKGQLKIRAKSHFEETREKPGFSGHQKSEGFSREKDRKSIIFTEIPYMTNKSTMIEEMAALVNDKQIEGISDIRDESDRDGIRVVVELKKDATPDVVLNQLYKKTALQSTFGIIMLALHENQPLVMSLKQMIGYFIAHRKEVVIKRSQFELRKAEERLHIIEGLKIALANIDSIVQTIKRSASPESARQALMTGFKLSEIQANAILDMKLQKLTTLEQGKLLKEHEELIKLITDLKDLLASEVRILDVIKKEIIDLRDKYGDERKTEIIEEAGEIEAEDLIQDEDVVVTVSQTGYIKRTSIEEYRQQKRGGFGVIGAETKEEDAVDHIFTASTLSSILCFTNKGKIYWLKGYQIPAVSRYSMGKAIVNLLQLEEGEKVNALIPLKKFEQQHYLIMVTKKGLIKKTPIEAFASQRKTGIIAITLMPGDELVQVRLTPGRLKLILGTAEGLAVKFDEQDVRSMGRTAAGVRAVRLSKNDYVVGLEVALEIATLLTVTENGYGKRSPISEYRLIKRGGKGVINIKTAGRNGKVVGIKTVMPHDEIMLVTQNGVVIRVPAEGISEVGRNTQGVRIMKLREGDKVKSVTRIVIQKK